MLYPDNDRWVGRALDLYGEANHLQIEFMEKFINPNDVVIDAGANIGVMTIAFAKRVGLEGAVFAFEPQEFLYYALCGNVAANNLYNVRTFCEAVYDVSGEQLYCPSPKTKSCKDILFYEEKIESYASIFLTEKPRFDTDYVVSTTAIDDLGLERCNFIKLDVEGDELLALEGAVNTIQKLKPVILMETDPVNHPKLVDAITNLGYVNRPCRTKLYNPNNFFQNPVDELREAGNPNALMSNDMICYHKDVQFDMDMKYFKAVSA